MAIVSFIEQEDQADVIDPASVFTRRYPRILTHCQLWEEYPRDCIQSALIPARAPPKVAAADEFDLEVEYVDFDQFLMGF